MTKPKTANAPSARRMAGQGFVRRRRSLTRGLSTTAGANASRLSDSAAEITAAGEAGTTGETGAADDTGAVSTLAIGTTGAVGVVAGELARGGAAGAGAGAAGAGALALDAAAGAVTEGARVESVEAVEPGAPESIAAALAGKRTIAWHLGHLTLRPSTSVGTVNEAEQLGQSTATLDMGEGPRSIPEKSYNPRPKPSRLSPFYTLGRLATENSGSKVARCHCFKLARTTTSRRPP